MKGRPSKLPSDLFGVVITQPALFLCRALVGCFAQELYSAVRITYIIFNKQCGRTGCSSFSESLGSSGVFQIAILSFPNMPLQEGSKILSSWQNYLYTSRVEIIGGFVEVERAPGTFTHESREMPRDHACCATCTEVLNVLDDHRYGNI